MAELTFCKKKQTAFEQCFNMFVRTKTLFFVMFQVLLLNKLFWYLPPELFLGLSLILFHRCPDAVRHSYHAACHASFKKNVKTKNYEWSIDTIPTTQNCHLHICHKIATTQIHTKLYVKIHLCLPGHFVNRIFLHYTQKLQIGNQHKNKKAKHQQKIKHKSNLYI